MLAKEMLERAQWLPAHHLVAPATFDRCRHAKVNGSTHLWAPVTVQLGTPSSAEG